MKICISTTRPFHLFHLARELSVYGHEVDLYGYIPEFRAGFYNPGSAIYHSHFLMHSYKTILALQRPFPLIQKEYTEQLFDLEDRLMERIVPQCDVFIGLSALSIRSAQAAREKYGAKVLIERGSAHVLTQEKIHSEFPVAKLTTNYVERELRSYELADYVVIPSVFSKNSFIENGFEGSKIFTNNYGVNLERFQAIPRIEKGKNNQIKALFVGGWTYGKGCDFIVDALCELPDLLVTHAGNVGDYGVTSHPRLKKLGHVENNRLSDLMLEHDVLILPSRQDGFGMVLLEALACGLPIVASKNTGAPDIREQINSDVIVLMDELSGKSLAESIQKSFESNYDADRSALSEIVKNTYSWKSYGKRYNDFITNVVGKSA